MTSRTSTSTTETATGNGDAVPNAMPVQTLKTSEKEQMTSARDQRASKRYKHTFAVHYQSVPSLFSPDTPKPPTTLGFRNLMGLVIFFSNLRLMVDNFQKYGILVTVAGAEISDRDWYWFIVLYALTPCHLFLAYLIEYYAAQAAVRATGSQKKGKDSQLGHEPIKEAVFSTWTMIALLHALNATVMLVFASWKVYTNIHNPGLGTFVEIHSIVVWLKVCSYAFTNRDLRHALLNPDHSGEPLLPPLYKACPYPRNVNFGNLCYFWWAPTLVYQPVYPRSAKIRWDFVVRRLCEFALLCVLIWVTSAQYAVPLLRNSVDDISHFRVLHILERVMKLSTISLVCWLAGFFAIFQSLLNALAELMRFGDRDFYGDWWNSSDIGSYWTSWNKPVTHFMKRHIYAPMVGRGMPPFAAALLTFLFSGILHELLVGVPTHNILGVAFFGMVGQIPLIIFTDVLKRVFGTGPNVRLAGNLTFWISFCFFGQPVAALAYFFAWQNKFGVGARPQWPGMTGAAVPPVITV